MLKSVDVVLPSQQLSSNVLICIFKSDILRKHITYTYVHKHYFLIKIVQVGHCFSGRLEKILMNLELLGNHFVKCNYIHR